MQGSAFNRTRLLRRRLTFAAHQLGTTLDALQLQILEGWMENYLRTRRTAREAAQQELPGTDASSGQR